MALTERVVIKETTFNVFTWRVGMADFPNARPAGALIFDIPMSDKSDDRLSFIFSSEKIDSVIEKLQMMKEELERICNGAESS